jgi:hypothetical protein
VVRADRSRHRAGESRHAERQRKRYRYRQRRRWRFYLRAAAGHADSSVTPGDLRIAGTLSGNGGIDVQGTLEVAAATKFNGQVVLEPGSTLVVDSGGFQPSTNVEVGMGAAIDLRGLTYSASGIATFFPLSGKLTVVTTNPVIIGVGTIYGYGQGSFGLAADGFGGTLVTLTPIPSWVVSGGNLSGDFNDATHWAPQFPATTQNAQIGPQISAATAWTVDIAAAETASVQNLLLSTGGLGTLAVNGQLAVADSLTIDQGAVVSVAEAGAAVIGGGSASVAGALLITPGGGVTAGTNASIAGPVVDDGVLSVNTDPATQKDGTLSVGGALSGNGTVSVVNGILYVDSLGGFAGTVNVGDDLIIAHGGGGGATLNVAQQATIDLLGVSFDSAATISYDATTGLLTLEGQTLDVGPGLPQGEFTAVLDHSGTGTALINTGPPCFAAGTRLRTESSEVPVEMVRPGDRLLTATGRVATVAWVGWSTIDLRRHVAPQHAAPVRLVAGALAPGVPCRDLLVSPDHAIAMGSVLIPARLLCNGATIRAESGIDRVSYVHVELDRHDLLIAEGAAAESYLETGNRGLFSNSTGVRALFPDLRGAWGDRATRMIYAVHGCAKLHTGGRAVRAAHKRLRVRAERLGWRLTDNPALEIEGDHPGLAATPFGPDGVHLFLPPGSTTLCLRSRSFVPDELDPDAGDGRQLGVALAVRLDGRPIAASALARGWHAPQPGCRWRWTDGDALLIVRARAREVKITLKVMQACGRYWTPPAETAMASPAVGPARRAR